MKVLIDVSAGFSIGVAFTERGHDVVYVRDRDPCMADVDILRWALSEQRMVVTQDKDFGELVFRNKEQHCGVLLLRLEDANADKKHDITLEILDNYGDQLIDKYSVFQDNHLRIR
jgi:predicted nuclease of predicted toxin-antitoxin system